MEVMVQRVNAQALFVLLNGYLKFVLSLGLVSLWLNSVHFCKAFPELYIFHIVRVILQSSLYKLFPAVSLPVIQQDSPSPEQKVRVRRELLLHGLAKTNGLNHIRGLTPNHRLDHLRSVFCRIRRMLQRDIQVRLCLPVISLREGNLHEFILLKQLGHQLASFLCLSSFS